MLPVFLYFALAAVASDPIPVNTPRPAPEWALLERRLIEANNRAGEIFVARYTRPDGSLSWKDRYEGGMNSSDDAYEAFRGLSLHAAIGGHIELDRLHRRVWEGVTRQFTRYGNIYREFDSNWDWMHHGEGYTSFYTLGLVQPDDARFRARAARFAAMYTGDDPEAPNYNKELKLMRAVMNGSRGPKMEWTVRDWIPTNANLAYYHLPFDDIPGVPHPSGWVNDSSLGSIVSTMSARMARGDTPINLTAAPLMANAFLYTGEAKYKDWITDYLSSWIELTRRNNGITPDNAGLTGKIGEYLNGNWWGGYYGWKWPRGGLDIVRAASTAGKAAALLTGDTKWLALARSQMAVLRANSRLEDGTPTVAMRYDQRGWHHYQAEPSAPYTDLWFFSQDPADLDHVRRIDGNRGWIAFLQGKNPDFAVQSLRSELAAANRRLLRILDEHGDPETWVDSHWSSLDPVLTGALTQLVLGGPPVDLRGEMLHASVIYFDGRKKRPGLPPGVAALVSRIDPELIEVQLANLDPVSRREVWIQAGAYGEHSFTQVAVAGAGTHSIDASHFRLDLAPGAGTVIRAGFRRLVNKPSFGFPWSRRP
jgi:hypothetical protein